MLTSALSFDIALTSPFDHIFQPPRNTVILTVAISVDGSSQRPWLLGDP